MALGRTGGAKGGWRRPRVSSFGPLKEAASRFCPPYEVHKEEPSALRIILRDPKGHRPNVALQHRYVRRLFLRASYLRIGCTVPGAGPQQEGELAFRFRGPLSRQRPSVRWTSAIRDGDAWIGKLEQPLLRAVGHVEAVQSLTIRWRPRQQIWRVELETMSGSMVSGITAFLPIAVPFDRKEAEGIVELVDTLAATRS